MKRTMWVKVVTAEGDSEDSTFYGNNTGGFYATDYARSDNGSSIRCDREHTCCGRDERCASQPCYD